MYVKRSVSKSFKALSYHEDPYRNVKTRIPEDTFKGSTSANSMKLLTLLAGSAERKKAREGGPSRAFSIRAAIAAA